MDQEEQYNYIKTLEDRVNTLEEGEKRTIEQRETDNK